MPHRRAANTITVFLLRQPKWLLLSLCIVLVLIVGYVDYITGYEVSLFLFYAPPIMFALWFIDRDSAYLVALVSAIVWWWADVKAGHPYLLEWVQIYNTLVRLVFFLFVVVGGAALKSQRDSDEAEIELLERTQQLEREIIRISEREQQRFGQDLHDGLCQYFAAVGCAAASLKDDLQRLSLKESSAAGEITQLIKDGVIQTRNLARGLFPVQAEESGLQSALNELAVNSTKLLNIDCKLECEDPVAIHDNDAATHLYRIAQEALNNATRHGGASEVRIRISASGEFVTLRIADNGTGIPKSVQKRDGMGLKIMSYRARLIGGELGVAPGETGGTVVTCTFSQKNLTMEETDFEQAA